MRNPAVLAALGLLLAIFGVFIYIIHVVGNIRFGGLSKAVAMSFPFIFITSSAAFFAAVIPLFVFIVYSEDFQGINPLIPHHYVFIWKKTWKAFETGNWKLAVKDL